MTGRVVECPIDEMNRPRGRQQAKRTAEMSIATTASENRGERL
jgi:hypothetical protein